MSEHITPNYETISVIQKRELMELMRSSLLNAFSEQDYYDVLEIFQRIIKRLENIQKGGGGVMAECGKKDTCKNYEKKCSQCWANSSIYDTHPCYTSKDLVEVVRCKDCYYCRESDTTNRFFCTYQDTEFEIYPNSYCSNGTPKERGGEK